MRVTLERFSILRIPDQAPDVVKLARDQAELLGGLFPETLTRHRDVLHSAKNIARVAWNRTMEGYIVRGYDNRAKGIATVIMNKTVIHPVLGEVTGNDLDYWIELGSDTDVHLSTARELVRASSKLELRKSGLPRTTGPGTGGIMVDATVNRVMASTPLASRHNRGLQGFLDPAGEPAQLTVLSGESQFELDRGGQVVQLFRANYFVTKQSGGPVDIERAPEIPGNS